MTFIFALTMFLNTLLGTAPTSGTTVKLTSAQYKTLLSSSTDAAAYPAAGGTYTTPSGIVVVVDGNEF